MSTWAEIGLVVLFVLVNGYFSMSELAVVSLRDSQVRAMAGTGRRGQSVARLRADTNRFLSSVQIGVTLAGFFASSFGGATLAVRLEPRLRAAGLSAGLSSTLSLVIITVLVSYLSLVLGELAPKRIALQRTEAVARFSAPVLERLAFLTRPVVWLLGASTNLVVRLLGQDPNAEREEVSEEELRDMVVTHGQLGDEERRVLSDVFDASGRRLAEVMIPRTEVDFLAADLALLEAAAVVEDQPHSRYPVIGTSTDDVVGFVHVRDLLTAARRAGEHRPGTVRDLVRPVSLLPGSKTLLPALSEMRRSGRHLAVVVDEYGGTDGIVTLEDLVEELVGEIEDEYDESLVPGAATTDGSAELDGLLHRDDVDDAIGVELPEGPYETLAGFVMTALDRVPVVGDSVEALDRRFTVVQVDGRRPSRIRVETVSAPTPDDDESPAATDLDIHPRRSHE